MKLLLIQLLIYAGCLLALGSIIFALSAYGCSTKAEIMQFNYKYSPVTGCMIEHQPGKWIGIESYRVIE